MMNAVWHSLRPDAAERHKHAALAPCLSVHACMWTKLLSGVTRTAPNLAIAGYHQWFLAPHSGCNIHGQVCGIVSPCRAPQGRLLYETCPAS